MIVSRGTLTNVCSRPDNSSKTAKLFPICPPLVATTFDTMYTSGRNMVSPAPPVSQASNFGGVGGGGGAGGAGGAGGGHIDRRAHNLQLQVRLQDVF